MSQFGSQPNCRLRKRSSFKLEWVIYENNENATRFQAFGDGELGYENNKHNNSAGNRFTIA